MAHHKTTPRANIITVKDSNNTYVASCDGEKKSCTAGPENAARALAAKLLGIDHARVVLEALPQKEPGKYQYHVCPF